MLTPGVALAGTLDQQQTDTSGGPFGFGVGRSQAQTFTAGVTGGLDQVDLYLGKVGAPTEPVSVEIRSLSGGAPGSTVLASQSLPAASVPASPGSFVQIGFAAPTPVTAGTQYAIVTYSTNIYGWSASTADAYAGGAAFFTSTSPPTGVWTALTPTPRDLAFKTYVRPVTTPVGPTGQRAAALKKCKKKHSHKKRKKCRKRANLLPV